MTVRLHLALCAFSWLLFGACGVAWSQTAGTSATRLDPRFVVPYGRAITVTDLPETADSDGEVPPACARAPACQPAPTCEEDCPPRPCPVCCARPARPILAALERLWDQLRGCRQCTCPEDACETPSNCVARPVLGSALPHLLRPNLPDLPHVEGDPFRDDSVQAPVFPQEARRPPLKAGRSVPLNAGRPKPGQSAAAPLRTEAGKLRVAQSEPSLVPAE